MIRQNRFALLAAALGFALVGAGPASAQETKAGALTVTSPFARATPPGAQVAGGYMTIMNAGSSADRLVGVSADIAARGEIHEMKLDGGTMVMRPLANGIEVPAGGKVELKPGGLHVMFMGLTRQLKAGETVRATLQFEKAGKVEVVFPVVPIGGQAPQHGHGDHKSH